jgi:hypothetical protein
MKRPFPRFEVLGLAAALAAGAACTPNNSVKPGAPVLMEMSVVEPPAPGAYGPTLTTVTAMTTSCPTMTADGGVCVSASFPVCETADTNILCRCIPNPPTPASDGGTSDAGPSDAAMSDAAAGPSDAAAGGAGGSMTGAGGAGGQAGASSGSTKPDGTWSCSFAPTASVLYVFDRLLDTTPFDPNMGVPGVATISETPSNGRVSSLASYASNGLQNATIFRLLGFPDGPNVTVTGSPALPTSSTVAVMLDKTMVRAKDGTPFSGTGLLIDGAIKFKTQAFAVVTIATPPAPMGPADAAMMNPKPDMTPATVTFNNFIDVATLATHITASESAGNIAVDLASMDNLNVTVTPKANWPALTQITISVDAMTPDAVGDVLDPTGALTTSAQFMTGAK